MQFHQYTIILLMFPLGSTCLLTLQLLSDRFRASENDRVDLHTKSLLYAIYLSAMGCGWIGWSLHISDNKIWCEDIGFPPCFAVYGASKAFVVGFFLRRAKLAQGTIENKYLHYFFTYVGPLYLIIYFVIYCILSSIVFEGAYNQNGISHCQFGRWELWFPPLAGTVDIFNSVGTLLLFVYPLFRAMKAYNQLAHDQVDLEKLGFISAMKWNVSLTAIATASSFISPFMLMPAEKYVWLFCLGDPFINSMCTFFMISPNRRFAQRIFKSMYKLIKKQSNNETQLSQNVKQVGTQKKTPFEMGSIQIEQKPSTMNDKCDVKVDIVPGIEKKGVAGTPNKMKTKQKDGETPASPLMLQYERSYKHVKDHNK